MPFYLREDDPPAKREIMRAALSLFSERGLVATSIRDIAVESGYSNPALYKHFSSKEELALNLFETCHERVWASCSAALNSREDVPGKLEAYVDCWLKLMEEYPRVLAFLSDSARDLWPKAKVAVRRHTMIGLARTLVLEAFRGRRRPAPMTVDVAAASIEGTLAELARMIQLGVVEGPPARWHGALVKSFERMLS